MQQLPAFDSYKREKISADALQIMLDFAAGDKNLELHQLPVDWQQVYEGICRNGLVGLTYNFLQSYSGQAYPPNEFREAVRSTYYISAVRMTMMHRSMLIVMRTLNEAGLDYLIVKGPAVAFRFYEVPASRVFNDLDIVIHERDWENIHKILLEAGFEQDENLPKPPPKVVPQAVLYETKYYHQTLGLRVEVHYDDILNAGLASCDVEGFWQRSQLLTVQGVAFKVLCVEDQLIHLCAHAHYHGFVRLNWFSDIALILRSRKDTLDWELIQKVVAVEEIQVPMYYSLYFLQQLMGVSLPEEILEKWQPGRICRWLHEYYMPEAQVLSMCPMPMFAYSFYFLPLYRRLIPDLLIMGRKKDKIHYLVHLIIPPSDWLEYYYHLKSKRWIFLHYLLHPIRLLLIYIRETWQALTNRKEYFQLEIE